VGRVFFAENVRPRLWPAIGFVLVGLAVVAKIWSSDLALAGVGIAGLAAVAFGTDLMLGERLVTSTSPLPSAFWSVLFASLLWAVSSGGWTIAPAVLARRVSLGGHLAGTALPVWALLCYVMALGSFVPFLLDFIALSRLGATPMGVVATTEVLFGFAVAWMWLGETLDTPQVIGAFLAIAGVSVGQTGRHRPP